jgi:hypothetical protein
MFSLVKESVITRVSNAVAAGTTDVECTSVDMAGFDAVGFIVCFGTITGTAVTSVKIQGSSDNSTFVDLEATSITVADDDDNQVFVPETVRAPYRYIRAVIDRGTANAVIDSVVAVQHQARFMPVTQPSTTTGELNVAPIAGTA